MILHEQFETLVGSELNYKYHFNLIKYTKVYLTIHQGVFDQIEVYLDKKKQDQRPTAAHSLG